MDPETAARLPEPYARALELAAQGRSAEAIAEALGVDLAAVPALLSIAAEKAVRAARAVAQNDRATPSGTEAAPRTRDLP